MKKTASIAVGTIILVFTILTNETYSQISQYQMDQADSSLVLHYQNLGYTTGLNTVVEYSTGPGGEEINVPVDLYVLNNADTNNIIGISHHLDEITEEMIAIAGQNPNQHLLLYDSTDFQEQNEYFLKAKNDIDSLLLITRINLFSKYRNVHKPKMKVYPNPARNTFNIELTTYNNAFATINLYNNFGELIKTFSKDTKLNAGIQSFRWNPTTLSGGIFYLQTFLLYENGTKENLSVKMVYDK